MTDDELNTALGRRLVAVEQRVATLEASRSIVRDRETASAVLAAAEYQAAAMASREQDAKDRIEGLSAKAREDVWLKVEIPRGYRDPQGMRPTKISTMIRDPRGRASTWVIDEVEGPLFVCMRTSEWRARLEVDAELATHVSAGRLAVEQVPESEALALEMRATR